MDADARFYAYQAAQDQAADPQDFVPGFERAARYYKALLGPHLPSVKAPLRALDVACGRGNFLYFLRELGVQDALGVDTNAERLRIASGLGLRVENADAFQYLNEHPQSYDLISALDFLEHLPKEATHAFLEAARGALRPGGVLLLRTACADGPFGAASRYNDFTHHQSFTSGLARDLLHMHGLEQVTVLGETPRPYNARNAVRTVAFKLARPVASAALMALGLGSPAVWSRDMWCIGRLPR